jgi:hypothetical protein
MAGSLFRDYLRLRLLVGYLGEGAQYGWWPTALFEPSSRLFLTPAFAKTNRLAQYHGVREAARRLHDEHVGVGQSTLHLFRLPDEAEEGLQKLLLGEPSSDDLFTSLSGQARALETLALSFFNARGKKSSSTARNRGTRPRRKTPPAGT